MDTNDLAAVPEWEKAVKKLIDQGLYRDVLIVTTGSKATDLRRGSERLPGRKGKLKKSEYIFLPIPYREFHENAHRELEDKTWMAYLLAGGSPIALNDIYQFEHLPEYFIQLTRDWILGEVVSSGRSRTALTQLLQILFKYGGSPVGYAKLAREGGLANNTVASGYVEQLADLLSVLAGVDNPEALGFWISKEHEIDFVTPDHQFIEVKRGKAGPLDFAWFGRVFPKSHLTVISQNRFQTGQITGLTIEDFLLGK